MTFSLRLKGNKLHLINDSKTKKELFVNEMQFNSVDGLFIYGTNLRFQQFNRHYFAEIFYSGVRNFYFARLDKMRITGQG